MDEEELLQSLYHKIIWFGKDFQAAKFNLGIQICLACLCNMKNMCAKATGQTARE